MNAMSDGDRPLRVLITNNTLAGRAGSELVVRDLALGLARRGHLPVAYSTVLGEVADELRSATIPVIEDLSDLGEPPDVIHGHHHVETMTAALFFPESPVINVCHGWLPWEEYPPVIDSIFRYVAVDDLCRERLLTTGIAPDRVSMIYNFADLDRFKQRSPLPASPKRALVFSNYSSGVHEEIRAGCAKAGIEEVEILGSSAGNPSATPEAVVGQFDVVFAKGRAAIEALACGCAVIVCDYSRMGGLVTASNLAHFRRFNFGVRTLQRPLDREAIALEFASYDAQDAQRVSDWMRANASLKDALGQYIAVYRDALAGRETSPTIQSLRLAGRYLQWLSPTIKDGNRALYFEARLRTENGELSKKLRTASEAANDARVEADGIRGQVHEAKTAAAAEAAQLRQQLLSNDEAAEAKLQMERAAADATIRHLAARQEAVESELNELRSRNLRLSEGAEMFENEVTLIKSSRAWRALEAYRRLRNRIWKP